MANWGKGSEYISTVTESGQTLIIVTNCAPTSNPLLTLTEFQFIVRTPNRDTYDEASIRVQISPHLLRSIINKLVRGF